MTSMIQTKYQDQRAIRLAARTQLYGYQREQQTSFFSLALFAKLASSFALLLLLFVSRPTVCGPLSCNHLKFDSNCASPISRPRGCCVRVCRGPTSGRRATQLGSARSSGHSGGYSDSPAARGESNYLYWPQTRAREGSSDF